ncbi:hypothetical protein GH714_033012 [Hevea brasiliensis]|uniref:Nuclear condensin complex subunit 3 C-terminal domain-containing protein n=1 Tax=Hevea brasiliensis TaxID=3981 RepID=A0A6A6L5B7_HEVBR|nr:hypothetical protein GH714_033012 [Hevea brasiliensis]
MACKALIDLAMWHGPQEIDKALGQEHVSGFQDSKKAFNAVNISDADENLNIELLDLLYAGLGRNDWVKSVEFDENETVQAILGEGFAKILLLSEKYPSIPTSLHPQILAKLIILYFSNETKDLQRWNFCVHCFLMIKCLSKAFVPVMRSMWPGIYGNAGGAASLVSNMRKRAVQASRFMLQMMQAPLFAKQTKIEDENGSTELPETIDSTLQPSFDCGEEGLAICIAAEVASFAIKKTPAEKSYISALSRILVLLRFRLSEQEAIKLMRRLLNHVAESISAEKDLVKELKLMVERLKSLDKQPDEELSQDQANQILGRLELDFNLDVDSCDAVPQTPAPLQSSKRTRPKDEQVRSQRASKTAALSKMTGSRVRIAENDDEEEGSEVISEEDSDDSDQYTE